MHVLERTPAWQGARVAALAFAVVLAVLSLRAWTKLNVPGERDALRWGLSDFRDAIYYPAVAFLAGDNPYDTAIYMRKYPVGNRFPAYLPATLVVHAPFALLPFPLAELVYYALTAALMPVIVWLALRGCDVAPTPARVLGGAAVLLASRAGHWDLLLGQYAATLTVGTYVALQDARARPWRAGMGLALASIKPTYGAPLAFLMLLRGDWRAVLIGGAISGALSAIATARLANAAGGFGPLLQSVRTNVDTFNTAGPGHAVESLYRLDAVSVVARAVGHPLGTAAELLVTAGVLALGALAVRSCARLGGDAAAARLSAAATCVTLLVVVYHMGYDLVVLTWPVAAVVVNRWAPRSVAAPALRWTLATLLIVPLYNYLASQTAMDALGTGHTTQIAVAAVNGSALLVALALYAVVARRACRQAEGGRARAPS